MHYRVVQNNGSVDHYRSFQGMVDAMNTSDEEFEKIIHFEGVDLRKEPAFDDMKGWKKWAHVSKSYFFADVERFEFVD